MNWFGRIKRKYIGAGLNNTASENPAVRHVPLQLICPPAGWALFNPDPSSNCKTINTLPVKVPQGAD